MQMLAIKSTCGSLPPKSYDNKLARTANNRLAKMQLVKLMIQYSSS